MLIHMAFAWNDFFRVPTITVGIDHIVLYNSTVQNEIELAHDLEAGPHEFWIQHHGKQAHETNQHHDTHVFLKRLLFDQIDLDQIDYCKLTHKGQYYPEYNPDYVKTCAEQHIELPEYIQPNHYFGHNGTWRLAFNAPVMNWIIEEQNPSGMNLEDTMFSSSQITLQQVKDLFNI